ncbi:MAG: DUF3131 domain-containing protein [Candidatus Bathyarchaeia archaeon]
MKRKLKYLLVTLLIALTIVSAAIVFIPMGGGQQKSPVGDQTYWMQIAQNAWNYFQPGKGVNAQTGLHGAGIGWPYFTDWDLGLYIQAIIDAERLGIVSRTGTWGSDYRFDKILTFLENRELTAIRLPYVWYDQGTGGRYGDAEANACDTGKLLVALQNLKTLRPELTSRVNYIVYNRTNYEPFMHALDLLVGRLSVYDYYVARGFAFFWPEKFPPIADAIINAIVTAPRVETYGVTVPAASLTCEVILHSVFELPADARVTGLADQVYQAHEARYEATGKYVAFSEGNTGLSDISYVYESVVNPDGRTWVIKDPAGNDVGIKPIVFLKAAAGLLALHNTEFTRNMMTYILSRLSQPDSGYMDGVDEDGRVVSTLIDKTNGLLIGAARYAIAGMPNPTPSPSPTYIPTPTPPPPTSSPSSSPSSSPTASPTPSASPSQSPPPTSPPMARVDLGKYPLPFVDSNVANNTKLVIGESQPHGPVGAAGTIDALGGMLIMRSLAREASFGLLNAAMDTWVITYDPNGANPTLLDNAANLIVIGGPDVNSLAYYYNSSRWQGGNLLAPVVMTTNSTGAFLYVPVSGLTYKMEFDANGRVATDYGVIMVFQDQNGRQVALVYGLGGDGTRIASEALSNFSTWNLGGQAVIIKYEDTDGDGRLDKSSIVEVVH